MGFLTTSALRPAGTPGPLPDLAPMVEAVMISQGLRLRVGPRPDDLCAVEDLQLGEPVWNMASGRLVSLDTISCATLDIGRLRDMGLCPMPLQGERAAGYLALPSTRLAGPSPEAAPFAPISFFRFWPETRLVAEVEGRPVLLRQP